MFLIIEIILNSLLISCLQISRLHQSIFSNFFEKRSPGDLRSLLVEDLDNLINSMRLVVQIGKTEHWMDHQFLALLQEKRLVYENREDLSQPVERQAHTAKSVNIWREFFTTHSKKSNTISFIPYVHENWCILSKHNKVEI